jgi:hypothetical protein
VKPLVLFVLGDRLNLPMGKEARMSATSALKIEDGLWSPHLRDGRSVGSELAAWQKKPQSRPYSLFDAWKMTRILKRLNRESEAIILHFERIVELHSAHPLSGLEAKMEYGMAQDWIMDVQGVCAIVLSLQAGFSHYGWLGEKLNRLRANSERLLDLADWLEAMSKPEELEAIFDTALADLANGDVIPWSALQ